MKIFIPILVSMAVALAEPPVGDGYPAARSSHDDHHHDHDHHQDHQHDHHEDNHASDHQRSLSQEYGPPSDTFESTRNAPSEGYDYNAPNARASSNARGRSQFPPATVRVSFNQRFSSAAARNSNKAKNQPQSRSNTRTNQGYAPVTRTLSQEYGTPAAVSARTLSTEYGMPDARSTPSQEYGVPVVAARNNQEQNSPSNFRNAQPSRSHDHVTPAARSQSFGPASRSYSPSSSRTNDVTQGYESSKPVFGALNAPSSNYDDPSARSHSGVASTSARNAPLSNYDAPSARSHSGVASVSARNAPSLNYDAPSARSQSGAASSRNSNSQTVDSISETPNQRELSKTYGAPSARNQPQDHDVPSSIANLMTSAVASSFASISSRSSPSSSYLPTSRSAPPSEEYGTPEQRDGSEEGYDYSSRARALEEELKNQEPASYDFGYQVEDQESGSDFGHTETREADKAQGSYFVVRPDGSKQTVDYEADERGFKPRISVEPADAAARAGGYDNNAQDLTNQGPY